MSWAFCKKVKTDVGKKGKKRKGKERKGQEDSGMGICMRGQVIREAEDKHFCSMSSSVDQIMVKTDSSVAKRTQSWRDDISS